MTAKPTPLPEERRRTPRVEISSNAVERPRSVTVRVIDISMTGALLASAAQIVPGQRAELRAILGGESLVADVEVRRATPAPGDARPGEPKAARVGVAFESLDERSQLAVLGFIGRKTR